VCSTDGTTDYTDLADARDAVGTTWVRVSDGTPAELDRVAETFGIHSLSVEDVRNDVRPKTEEYDDHTFVLLNTASLRRGETTFEEEIRSRNVGLFVDDWLVSLSTHDLPAVERV
jgi:magnesium transporter